ncbi:MAG: SDR family oxidoreductase, partial [Planctomycetota bacterium]
SLQLIAADGVAHALQLDLLEPDAPQHLASEVQSRFGSLDALVNNAGANLRKPTEAYADDEIDRLFKLLLSAQLNVTRALAPALRASGRGAVVNISSVASSVSVGSGAPYAAAKAGLDQLTRYLAVEWAPTPDAPGIRVNAVSPWYIHAARPPRPRRPRAARADHRRYAHAPRRHARRGRRLGRVLAVSDCRVHHRSVHRR